MPTKKTKKDIDSPIVITHEMIEEVKKNQEDGLFGEESLAKSITDLFMEMSSLFTLKVKRQHPSVLFDSNPLGWNLYLLSDVEIQGGLTSEAKTGIIVDVPKGYYVTVRISPDLVLNNITMAESCLYLSGKKEVTFHLANIGNQYNLLRKGRKVAEMSLHKLENVQVDLT